MVRFKRMEDNVIKPVRTAQPLDCQHNTQQSRSQKYVRKSQDLLWWAMSAPYCRELRAAADLSARGIVSFIPMKQQPCKDSSGRYCCSEVPALHNLIFVRASQQQIRQAKGELPYLQYRTMPREGRNRPIIVPEGDMEQFMAACRCKCQEKVYVKPGDVDIEKGQRVRIIGGALNGIEGVFVKVKGHRKRKVVVMLRNLIGLAIDAQPDLLELLPAGNERLAI